MGRRTALPWTLDILTAITRIQSWLDSKSHADYLADDLLRNAVERQIEIISEAVRHIPAELRAHHPSIDWASIAGIGNVFRHEYFRVQDQIVWHAATLELQPLASAVSDLRGRLLRERESAPEPD